MASNPPEIAVSDEYSNRTQVNFNHCPKYVKHDISEDQMLELIERGVDLYVARQEQEIGRLTKKGFMYLLGAIGLGVYSWAVAHGFIEVK